MSSDMLLRSSSWPVFPMEGPEAGKPGLGGSASALLQAAREPLPNMYSHPDKWKELSMGREGRTGPGQGWWA